MVMTDIKILQEMINDDAKEDIENGGYVFLKEYDDCKQLSYSVKITGLPQNAFVLKADSFQEFASILKCNSDIGQCCRADYVIIADDGKDKQILYIELKGGRRKPQTERIANQLKGAKCLIEYCRAIGNAFWDGGGDFLKGYTPQYILILQKLKIKTVIRQRHSTPDVPKVFQGKNDLRYNQLAS